MAILKINNKNNKIKNNMPTQIEQDILKELGIDSLPAERQEEVLTAMTEAVLKRLMLRLIGAMSEEQRKEFQAIADAGEQEKISQFLSANVPNYETLIKEEAISFKKDMQKTVDGLLA